MLKKSAVTIKSVKTVVKKVSDRRATHVSFRLLNGIVMLFLNLSIPSQFMCLLEQNWRRMAENACSKGVPRLWIVPIDATKKTTTSK